jgi:hypothetical protein
MKFLKTLILFLWAFNLEAQVEAILHNPNIVWAAETQSDFVVDKPYHKLKEQLNNLSLIKLLVKEDNLESNEDDFLLQHILSAVYTRKLAVFADSDLKNSLSLNQISRIDTVTVVDPITYETKQKTVISKPPVDSFRFFRTRQIVYYNTQNASWGLQTLAIAPLGLSNEGVFQPLFWIPVENIKPNIGSDDIIWAKRITTRSKNIVHIDSVKILKKTGEPMVHFFKQVKKNFKMPVYDSENYAERKKLSLTDRVNFATRTDTITQVDPTTFETRLKIIITPLDFSVVKNLQLVQEWYWDERKAKLFIHLAAVAPMRIILDDEGDFLFFQPLLYRRNNDD